MNSNKNPNLPANAIRTTDVRVGMFIERPGGFVSKVTSVWFGGFNGIIVADGERIRVNAAGTLRLAEPLD
jgi:hypothetical protein